MNDAPLAGVRVIFVPEGKGSPSYGSTDKSGQFKLMYSPHRTGAELGIHQVLLKTREPLTDDGGNLLGGETPVEIPEKYRRPGALSVNVTAGRNRFDFRIEPKSSRG